MNLERVFDSLRLLYFCNLMLEKETIGTSVKLERMSDDFCLLIWIFFRFYSDLLIYLRKKGLTAGLFE
jgi:hypothetical protein